MKRLLISTAALALAIGCVPQGGPADGDPGMELDVGMLEGNNPGNNPGGPRIGGVVNYAGAGVQPTDSVADLDDAQREAACGALATAFGDALSEAQILEFSCGLQGLIFGGFSEQDPVGACRMVYDECRANPGELMLEDDEDEVCPLVEHPDCTATLQEIETCIEDGMQALTAFIDDFDCALAAEIGDPDEMEDPEAGSAACASVEMQCPGLFEDDEAPEDTLDGTGSEDPFAE